jgi:hypothetical protein
MVRYTFTVMDLRHLLLAGLPAHCFKFRIVSSPHLWRRATGRSHREVERSRNLRGHVLTLPMLFHVEICEHHQIIHIPG